MNLEEGTYKLLKNYNWWDCLTILKINFSFQFILKKCWRKWTMLKKMVKADYPSVKYVKKVVNLFQWNQWESAIYYKNDTNDENDTSQQCDYIFWTHSRHSFIKILTSTFAKFPEKPKFFTSWYVGKKC